MNFSLKLFLTVSILFFALSVRAEQVLMPQVEITYDESALNYYSYITGLVKITDTDGTVTEYNTLYKTRGATAQQYKLKPSLNMKIRDAAGEELDVDMLGLRTASSFILDAMAIDRINMRNRVCFDIWNAFSCLPYETDFDNRNGTIGKFIEVSINGKYKGIYCLSDKINRKLLGLKKPKIDGDGNVTYRGLLYKNGTNDIGNQENVGMFNDGLVYVLQWHDAWELHEPDDYPSEEAWAPMLDLYADNNYANYDYVKEHFYLENLADYTIHLMALCIQDNWGNKNKYFSIANLQGSGDETKFVVTPWDLDTSLGGSWDGSYYGGHYAKWSMADIMKNPPKPFGAVVGQQEFKNILKARWIEGRIGAFAIDSVSKRLYDYCNLFEESGAWQRTVDRNLGESGDKIVKDLRQEIDLIVEWYADRFRQMDEYFSISEENTAGVEITTPDDDNTEKIYNLQGFPVTRPVAPGIYIVNGKLRKL